MEEDDSKDHPETTASTPDSTAGTVNELKTSKDRSCPFCGQAFTSSSLGRHLDLYIRPRNPKPPDGVHDVHEIRKIRGSITRRQPRTSSKTAGNKDSVSRRNSSGWSSQAATKAVKGEKTVTDTTPVESPVITKETSMHNWSFNAPNWQATGVINDLPARAPSRAQNGTPVGQPRRMQEMRQDSNGKRIQRPEYVSDDMWKLQETAEVGRAAEMALREVLGSLEAAKKRVEPTKLFDGLDVCQLSFPGLCLALLQPPPTLFSSTPFPAAHTWSLSPPGAKQKDTLFRRLTEETTRVLSEDPNNMPESRIFGYNVHLQGAWEHWQLLTEDDRLASWNLELSRAFVREREKNQKLEMELEVSRQRARHLEAEYDRLSKCQLPRESLLRPPNTMPVSSAVMREMQSTDTKSGGLEVDYDADALINKWKTAVKATTRAGRGPPQAQPYVERSYNYIETQKNPLKADMVMNGSVFAVNGAMPREIDQQTLTYETPQNPGAIVTEEEEADAEAEIDAEGDAEGGLEEQISHSSHVNSRALTKLRSAIRGPSSNMINGNVNANGKRPLATTSSGGRLGETRKQPKG